MSQGMYNPYNTGTAAAGGKGGTMGGFSGGSMGGKGGMTGGAVPTPQVPSAPPTAPPTAPPVAPPPVEDPAQNAQGPNAFETGLNAQNEAMAFYQNAMSGGAQNIMDMISKMSQGGGNPIIATMGGGGGGGPAYEVEQIARDVYDYDPAQVNAQGYSAAQLSDADISQYMNPYTQDVIDTTMADLDKARLSALNSTGAAASRGGAFGGDRHGIMEAQNNADYLSQVARSSAQLRNQGYQNAQNAAMADINSTNQARAYNAQEQMAANMANAQAANDRSQFVGSTANSNELAAQRIEAQMAAQGAGGGGDNGRAAIAQANAQLKAQAQQNALQAAMQMYGMQFDAANNFYQMGGDRYGMGQDALNAMGDVGSQIDSQNQNLIDATRRDFERLAGAPRDQYSDMLSALSALSGSGSTTSSYNPGMFDYLKAGTSMFGLGK